MVQGLALTALLCFSSHIGSECAHGGGSLKRFALKITYVEGGTSPVGDRAYQRFAVALERRFNAAGQRAELVRRPCVGATEEETVRCVQASVDANPNSLLLAATGSVAIASRRLQPRPKTLFSVVADPVALGIVNSLATPGDWATGVSSHLELGAKPIELLVRLYPSIRRVAILTDPGWMAEGDNAEVERGCVQLGLACGWVTLQNPTLGEITHDLASYAPDALYVPLSYTYYRNAQAVVDQIAQLGRPAVFAHAPALQYGAAVAAYPDSSGNAAALAEMALLVAQGTPISQIPVRRPSGVVNAHNTAILAAREKPTRRVLASLHQAGP